MRVAITLEQLWHRVPGGVARATLDTVAAVEARGGVDQVGVSAWHGGPPPEAWRTTIPIRRLPLPRLALYDAWQRLRHPRVERATGRVDLVHATGHVAPAARAPWVATVYDLHFLHEPDHFTPRGVSVFNRFLDLVRDEAAAVICPSEATQRDCVDAGIDAARTAVAPCATNAVAVAPGAADEVRGRYGLTGRFVLFTGTVEPRKNLGRLIEAVQRLDADDVELVVVGPPGWRTDLPDHGVRRLGFVPQADRDALYAAADVVCYPSIREGFGLPVLEAMVQGAAVVTSATTSTAEVAGDAGLLVDPLDVDAIAVALQQVLDDDDLAARLRHAARLRAATFTWERTADATVAVYESVLGGPR